MKIVVGRLSSSWGWRGREWEALFHFNGWSDISLGFHVWPPGQTSSCTFPVGSFGLGGGCCIDFIHRVPTRMPIVPHSTSSVAGLTICFKEIQ
jgi:hypothetical protein